MRPPKTAALSVWDSFSLNKFLLLFPILFLSSAVRPIGDSPSFRPSISRYKRPPTGKNNIFIYTHTHNEVEMCILILSKILSESLQFSWSDFGTNLFNFWVSVCRSAAICLLLGGPAGLQDWEFQVVGLLLFLHTRESLSVNTFTTRRAIRFFPFFASVFFVKNHRMA